MALRITKIAPAAAAIYRVSVHPVHPLGGKELRAPRRLQLRHRRERAVGADLLQQAGADEFIDNRSGRFALDIRWQFNSAIIAPRSRGQNDELRIGTVTLPLCSRVNASPF